MRIHINLNNVARVKLNKHGIEVLRKLNVLDTYKPDENGLTQFMLWQLMYYFGKYMYNGSPVVPFDTDFEVEDL